ncbi:rhomboid family intramembrane serine protease [Bauldia sp.]|uniref:rhomboid family intramembrane serine protease n=1 Tax=Bauldia sp. TaxID=2575872 RepID=UPI003BA8A459
MPIFPIHDGRPLVHISRPYGCWALLAANVFVYFVVQSGGLSSVSQSSVLSYGLIPAVYNDHLALPPEYEAIPEWLTIITYSFLHGDLWHLIGNMLFLWVFADNVEDAFGHIRFIVFYLLCAAGAGYAFVWSDPTGQAPVVGASGAVAGVVAAYLMLHPKQKIWILALGRIPLRLRAYWVLGFWVLYQVYQVVIARPGDQVAWWSHIGGLITGAVLVVLMRRPGVPLFDRPPGPDAPAPWGSIDDDEGRR